jgi:dipeptidyl aminopeptidase/acylaminoacyl peptidase
MWQSAGGAKVAASIRFGLRIGLVLAALGVPALSSGAGAVSPRQLVEIADFSSPVISPDGSSVAYRVERASIERNTYDSVWYVQRMDGASPPRRVGDGGIPLRDSAGIPVPATVDWSPDGRWIYYRASIDGKIDVWRAASDGSGSEAVTRDAAGVRDFALSADGRTVEYSIGPTREEVLAVEQAEYDRGIHVDRSTPIGQSLFRSGFVEGRLATQRLGLMFNRVGLTDDIPDRWKAIDLATRKEEDLAKSNVPATPPTPPELARRVADIWKIAREPGGERIALLTRTETRRADAHAGLMMVPDLGADPVKCGASECSDSQITGIDWRPGTDEVLFTLSPYDRGFAQSVYRWNVKTGAVLPVASSTGLLAGEQRWAFGTCGISATALACVTATADRPPRLETIDIETGARRVLFDPNAGLARELAAISVQPLRWTDANGRAFTGQFYPARGAGGPLPPLFITYYRCAGFLRGGSGDEWPLATLAENGIATLCINAPTFSASAAERYGAGLSSVKSVIALLGSRHLIDTSRVGMGGLSFGAEVTMWTLIHSDLIAAASVATPTTSQQYYLLGTNIGQEFISLLRSNWQLGPPDETPRRWKQISPASNLKKLHAPILMQMPEQEYMFGLDYEIPLMLDEKADLYVFPNEPHNKFQPRHKLAVYERNLDWFRFWLQGHEDSDPQKAEQYRSWEAMRAQRAASAPK